MKNKTFNFVENITLSNIIAYKHLILVIIGKVFLYRIYNVPSKNF